MSHPLSLGYFLPQCLESILRAVFVTPPVAAHGQMSGCLFISGNERLHMFVSLAVSECVAQNPTHTDGRWGGHTNTFWSIKTVPLILCFYLQTPADYILSEFLQLFSSPGNPVTSSPIFHLLISIYLVISTQWISTPLRSLEDKYRQFLSSPPLCTRVLPVLSLTFHLICLRHHRAPAGFFFFLFHSLDHKPSMYAKCRPGMWVCSRACGCGSAAISPGFRSRLC